MRSRVLIVALALAAVLALAHVAVDLTASFAQIRAVTRPTHDNRTASTFDSVATAPTRARASNGPNATSRAVTETASAISATAVSAAANSASVEEPDAPAAAPAAPFDVDGLIGTAIEIDRSVAEVIDDPDPRVRAALRDFIATTTARAPPAE